MRPQVQFKTTLQKIDNWTIARLPADQSAKLPSRGQVMVVGSINGLELKTPIEPDGLGSHWIEVNKNMLKDLGLSAGDTVDIQLDATNIWPEPVVPADVIKALKTDADVLAQWNRVTPLARWEWLRWIGSTKQLATRQKRIEVSCDKLKRGERRPCCFNRSMCCVPDVSKNGVLLSVS